MMRGDLSSEARAVVDALSHHAPAARRAIVYLGIDPGLSGAWTMLGADGSLVDSGIVPQRAGKTGKATVDLATLVSELRRALDGREVVAAVERVQARPGEGGSGAFTFGRTVGAWDGIVVCLGLRRVDVEPGRWSRLVSPTPIRVTPEPPEDDTPKAAKKAKDKAKARERALRKEAAATTAASRWPTLPLERKKDWPRADAAWIAEWARQEDVRVGRISA